MRADWFEPLADGSCSHFKPDAQRHETSHLTSTQQPSFLLRFSSQNGTSHCYSMSNVTGLTALRTVIQDRISSIPHCPWRGPVDQ